MPDTLPNRFLFAAPPGPAGPRRAPGRRTRTAASRPLRLAAKRVQRGCHVLVVVEVVEADAEPVAEQLGADPGGAQPHADGIGVPYPDDGDMAGLPGACRRGADLQRSVPEGCRQVQAVPLDRCRRESG